jgi:hypothetical protein
MVTRGAKGKRSKSSGGTESTAGKRAVRARTNESAGPAAEAAPPAVVGSQKAFLDFLPQAEKLGAGEVVGYRADAALAYHNVAAGWRSVAPLAARVRDELPKVDWRELEALLDLASAVVFAAAQVDSRPASPGEISKQLAQARPLRAMLLASADAVAKKGLIPVREVQRIQAGQGQRDTAQDCIDLAALWSRYPDAFRHRSPAEPSDLTQAAQLGSALIAVLKPKGAKRQATVRAPGAEARDRLWTLLQRRHDMLRRVGGYLWGDAALDEHVPSLQARLPTGKRSAVPEEPAQPATKVQQPEAPAPAPESAAGSPPAPAAKTEAPAPAANKRAAAKRRRRKK